MILSLTHIVTIYRLINNNKYICVTGSMSHRSHISHIGNVTGCDRGLSQIESAPIQAFLYRCDNVTNRARPVESHKDQEQGSPKPFKSSGHDFDTSSGLETGRGLRSSLGMENR